MGKKAPETIQKIFELLSELATLDQEITMKQREFTKIENRLCSFCGKKYKDFKFLSEDK